MEKWLDAFAKGLLIQKDTDDGSKTEPASAEQMEAFKEALKANLNVHGQCRFIGDTITYDYRLGTIRGSSKGMEAAHVVSGNGNLLAVLGKMPKLPRGESYAFPTPTFITFRMKNKMGEGDDFDVINVCSWIQQNL